MGTVNFTATSFILCLLLAMSCSANYDSYNIESCENLASRMDSNSDLEVISRRYLCFFIEDMTNMSCYHYYSGGNGDIDDLMDIELINQYSFMGNESRPYMKNSQTKWWCLGLEVLTYRIKFNFTAMHQYSTRFEPIRGFENVKQSDLIDEFNRNRVKDLSLVFSFPKPLPMGFIQLSGDCDPLNNENLNYNKCTRNVKVLLQREIIFDGHDATLPTSEGQRDNPNNAITNMAAATPPYEHREKTLQLKKLELIKLYREKLAVSNGTTMMHIKYLFRKDSALPASVAGIGHLIETIPTMDLVLDNADLSGDKLDSLIGDLPYLKYLTINNASITDIPKDIWRRVPNLELLSITGNKMRSIPDGLIDQLPRLEFLDIMLQQVDEFELSNISSARSLRRLGLYGLPIEHLDISLLPPSLEFLDLRDCPLKSITGDKALHLPALKEMVISDESQSIFDDWNFANRTYIWRRETPCNVFIFRQYDYPRQAFMQTEFAIDCYNGRT